MSGRFTSKHKLPLITTHLRLAPLYESIYTVHFTPSDRLNVTERRQCVRTLMTMYRHVIIQRTKEKKKKRRLDPNVHTLRTSVVRVVMRSLSSRQTCQDSRLQEQETEIETTSTCLCRLYFCIFLSHDVSEYHLWPTFLIK